VTASAEDERESRGMTGNACYTVNEQGNRVFWLIVPSGTKLHVIERGTGSAGIACMLREYREAWEGGPLWPVVEHETWPEPVLCNPAWLRVTKTRRPQIELPPMLR
jgi:hypothetical protein